MQTPNFDFYKPWVKINSKQNIDLKTKSKTIKILEENKKIDVIMGLSNIFRKLHQDYTYNKK